MLLDEVLYFAEKDGTVKVIPPTRGEDRYSTPSTVELMVLTWDLRSSLVSTIGGQVTVQTPLSGAEPVLSVVVGMLNQPPRSPLTPIPVAGAFDQIGVDAIQFPKSHSGKNYAVIFMDY